MRDKIDVEIRLDEIYGEDPQEKAKADALGWILGDSDPITGDDESTGKFATEDEVEKAIESLKNDRKTIPEFSMFGDPNWQQIDAQIEILRWVLK
jgi:hypothetical protein